MILNIDTSNRNLVKVWVLLDNKKKIKKECVCKNNQSEQLLVIIDNLFIDNKLKFNKIKEIRVNNKGDWFTSLRIGVLTANALSYALKVPVRSFDNNSEFIEGINLVKPKYNKKPNITTEKQKL